MRPNRTGMMGVRWATLGAVLACAIVVVVAVSACGGGDSGDNSQAAAYYASVAAASAKLDQRVSAYADHIQTADDPQIAASFSKFNDDLQDFAHDADVLKPPASVSDPHKRLVQATVDLGDAVFQQSLSGIGTH